MDNPGVYENAKFAYLHELLVSRKGVPAVLAILLEEVCQRLLSQGAIDFAVRVDCTSLDRCCPTLLSTASSHTAQILTAFEGSPCQSLAGLFTQTERRGRVEKLGIKNAHNSLAESSNIALPQILCCISSFQTFLPVEALERGGLKRRALTGIIATAQAAPSGGDSGAQQADGDARRRARAQHVLLGRAGGDAALPQARLLALPLAGNA